MRSRCALQGAHNPHALGAAERAREPRVLCVLCGLRPACLLTAAAHGCCSRLLLTAAGARTQGYLKKVRPGETTRYTGYLCRRDIHEFLFAETPVDEAAPPSSSAAAAQRLGCVAVTVFATRRVRVEDSSSDDEQGHSSSGAITATRLPEKQAVKGVRVSVRVRVRVRIRAMVTVTVEVGVRGRVRLRLRAQTCSGASGHEACAAHAIGDWPAPKSSTRRGV